MPIRKADSSLIYQFEVTLREIKPPIWRRIQVPGSLTWHSSTTPKAIPVVFSVPPARRLRRTGWPLRAWCASTMERSPRATCR